MCGETKDAEIDNVLPVELERCVNRLRNSNSDKFQEMCKMHLSFLLDFPSIEDFLSDPYEHSVSSETISSKNKKANTFTPFAKRKNKSSHSNGATLTESSINQIYQLVQYLGRPYNIKQEGIFRKNGHLNRQKTLKDRLQTGSPLQVEDGDFSAHDCANVLKSYLGDLPEPLLKDRFYKAHCQIPEMLPEDAKTNEAFTPELIQIKFQKQIKAVQLLFHLLPAENATVLESVLRLLHKVCIEEENKMTAETLGTLFAPHILCPRRITASELHAVSKNITRAMSFMIRHAPRLFTLPRDLAQDIANYWKQMEQEPVSRPASSSSEDDSEVVIDTLRLRHHSSKALNTCVQFAKPSSEADEKSDTEVALAQLYAYVQSLPESTKKRKLLKQFNKANNPCYGPNTPVGGRSKHKRSKSIGASLKKKFSKNKSKLDYTSSTYQGFNLSNDFTIDSSENTLDLDSSSDDILSSQFPHLDSRIRALRLRSLTCPRPELRSLTCPRPKTPRARTPVKRLFDIENKKHDISNDKVCIVDMNLSAPLLSSPSNLNRKRKPLEDCVLNRLTDSCEPPSKKSTTPSFADSLGKNIEALLSPIPHRSSIGGKKSMYTPRCRVPIVMCHSPDLLKQEDSRCSPLKMSKISWR